MSFLRVVRHPRHYWMLAGLASAGDAGRTALTATGHNVVIFDHERSGTTIVIAGSEDAKADLRAWFEHRQETHG